MASALARQRAYLLVDEVYLECLFGRTTESAVHAGANVIAANSLTKAYGLDGLRAGWLLGPPELMRRAWVMQDLLANNGVAPGEQLALAAFKRLPAIRAHAHKTLDPNLERVRDFFSRERRLEVFVPEGGNVAFPRLPRGNRRRDASPLISSSATRRSSFPAGSSSRRGTSVSASAAHRQLLDRGLANISRALDDLSVVRAEARPYVTPGGRLSPRVMAFIDRAP